MALARIRTINEAYAEIKEVDPRTAISKTYIRKLIVDGVVHSTKTGTRYLVNMDSLEEYLNNPGRGELDRVREFESARNKIRAVPE